MNATTLLFLPLQPPSGGLARLRFRVEQSAVQRRPWLVAATGFAATAALALIWLLSGTFAQHRETTRLTRALQAAVASPDNGIRVEHGAALALPSGQANVHIYLVETTPR